MQLLIAHGDAASRLALRRLAPGAEDGTMEVVECGDGMEAVETLLAADSPALALIDWDLPGCDGLELCRLVRAYHEAGPPYIIMLARSDHPLAEGLEAGADDCVHVPANGSELRARINVGRRFAALPWERLARAAFSAERSSEDDVAASGLDGGAAAALAAQRSQDDDDASERDGGAGGSAKFELASVLVAQ